jgi:hypothetical protein
VIHIVVLVPNIVTDDRNSLDIPRGLIELLVENSLNRERLLRITSDDLAFILSIDIEGANIILNSVTNYSNLMVQDMRELR